MTTLTMKTKDAAVEAIRQRHAVEADLFASLARATARGTTPKAWAEYVLRSVAAVMAEEGKAECVAMADAFTAECMDQLEVAAVVPLELGATSREVRMAALGDWLRAHDEEALV